jgi:hypothetical protein
MLEATTRSIRHVVYAQKYWCLFFLFLAINFVVIHRSLAEPGLILAGDFTRAEDFSKSVSSNLYPLWDEHGQFSNLPTLHQLGIYTPAIIISSIIGTPSTIVYLAYFLVLGSLSGVFSFKLAEYVMIRQNLTPRFEFPLASSLFFMFATFVVETTFHPAIAFSFYLSPLFLYAVIKGIEENRINYLLLSSLIYSLMAVTLHFAIFGLIILLSYTLYDFLYKTLVQRFRSFPVLKRTAWYTLIVFGPFIALSSYWLVPNLVSSGYALYSNLLTAEDPETSYRNVDIINIFSVKGFFNLYEIYVRSELTYTNILSIMLTVIAVSSLLFYKQNKLLIYLGILLVLCVIISVIPRYLPDLYNWLVFDAPGNSLYSWLFRAPKFHDFMSISIAAMLSLSGIRIYQILSRREKRFSQAFPLIFIAIVLVLTLVPNYTLLTGDFRGYHRSYELPGDYADLLAYLKKQDGNYKSIWGPPYAGLGSTSWNANKIGDVEQQISPINTFSNVETLGYYIYPVIFGIRFPYGSMVYEGQTNNLNEFLSPINVKYIVVHDDIPELKDRIDKLSTALNKQKGSSEIKEFGSLTLYTINDAAEQFSTKQSTMLIQGGGLLKFDSLFRTESINSSNIGAFFSDISLDQNSKMLNSSDTFIPENQLSYAEYMLDKSDAIIIPPAAYTNHFEPLKLWSKISANMPRFLNELERRSIELPYQFDYGKNIIFTSANNSHLEIPLSVSDAGEYKVLLRYFANDKGGLVDLNLNGKSLPLETRSHLNRFIWTDLGTLSLSEGTQTLSIENRNGFNALNLIALIPAEKYEEYKAEFANSLRDKDIIHIFEAESDFNFDRNAASPVVQSINYSNGKALKLSNQDTASTKFEILKDGKYNLTFYGKGTIIVDIDRMTTRTINLEGGVAHVEPITLNSGNHSIEIAPASGTNFSYLDSISMDLIMPDKGQSSLVQQQDENAIIRYYKVDPTNYEVNIKAESPFMLAFAEAYDERWTAEVETPSGVNKIYKPLPLYGVINGFWIDTEGEYVIHIKYAPQQIFYIGAGISAVSYSFVIVYLIRAGPHPILLRRSNNL